ncbi:MAG: glycosyltransferase family 2 protein [Ignavibacteria bacterium]|nr:glycosyltransferase family 2 protein [Ignavibacteria bacterium]
MKSAPLVSLGLPVFNGSNFLEETLISISEQTFSDYELIISDNASTDSTYEICIKYAEKDNRIILTRNEQNKGAAYNYNKVFNQSKGKYFKWAAHDDLYEKNYLEKLIIPLEKDNKCAISYPKRIIINEKGIKEEYISDNLNLESSDPVERYKKFLYKFRYNTVFCDPVFGLIRRDVLEKTKLIGSYPTSDMNLLGELALRGKFIEVEEYLFLRRRHPEMSSKKNPGNRERAEWFSPSNKGKIQLPRWRWLGEFISSIFRTDINFPKKIFCLMHTFHWSIYWSKSFIADIVREFLHLFYLLKK